MKILVLRTHSVDCGNKIMSLECLGHEVYVMRYDDRPHDRHVELVDEALALRPDAIVYIGAIEQFHDCRPVLSVDNLKKLRDIAPTIHICGDASDFPWWPWLEKYEKADCFAVQVSIDGNFDTPLASFPNGMVKLTPTSPKAFRIRSWQNRDIQAGFAGGLGHGERAGLVHYFAAMHSPVQWRPNFASYEELGDFMGRCKISVNHAMNGTGDKFHVKGRVVEAGFAVSCLLERANPHTAKWFKPGIEYVEYENVQHANEMLKYLCEEDEMVRNMANALFARVWIEHHPKKFWLDVFAKAGVLSNIAAQIG